VAKWDTIRGVLPTLDESAERGEVFGAALESYRGLAIDVITAQINDLREKKDALNAELSEIQLLLDAGERALDEALEASNLPFVGSNGYRWARGVEPYPKVEDKQALRAWAEVEMPDALSLQFNTLKATVKDRLEKGEALPDGVSVWAKNTIRRTKA
jgi:hypothetical protein